MTRENPVDYLIRRCGMTRIAFTREYGFGENHLLLIAQGRKTSVGPKLVDALHYACQKHGFTMSQSLDEHYGTPSLETAWVNWRKDRRAEAQVPEIPVGVGSPWARIVKQFGSIAQTAKALRVRDIHVRKYMDSPTMPSPIEDALLETSWSGNVERLDVAQHRYFKDKGRKR